jgi:uncharacterized protein
VRAALAAALAAVWLTWAPVQAQDVPPLTGHVNDYADLLGPEAEARVESELAGLEDETGAQVVILTEPSLEGGSLEEFTIRVAETWKLGRAEQDDGVLIFVSRDDRKIRIEVGYGLEGAIPDAYAKRIIDEQMVPSFRAGDYEGGLAAAAAAVAKLVRGEGLPPPEVTAPSAAAIGWMLASAALLLLGVALPSRLAWPLYFSVAPILAVTAAALGGFAAALVLTGLWLSLFPALRFVIRHVDWSSMSSGTWTTSSGGGGGWSGGGFSGGGGSFGGGGASGGW